jgi:hypothetical protein
MWNVYKFTQNGLVEYLVSQKSINYFRIETNPELIASNLTKEEAFDLEYKLR